MQLGLAAAEQRGEQLAEILVHRAEGIEQALAAFAVEAPDAAAQFGDGLDQIVAFLDEAVELLGHFLGLLLGAQIDAAEPLAIVAQAWRACARSRRWPEVLPTSRPAGGTISSGAHCSASRDAPLGFRMTLARRFEPGLETGVILARGREPVLRRAQGSASAARTAFSAVCQRIGRGLALGSPLRCSMFMSF